MVTGLGREGPGEREVEKCWQEGSSQQAVPHLSLANAFLRQGHLIGLMLVPAWCYALFNPKLPLKVCSTQCVCGI